MTIERRWVRLEWQEDSGDAKVWNESVCLEEAAIWPVSTRYVFQDFWQEIQQLLKDVRKRSSRVRDWSRPRPSKVSLYYRYTTVYRLQTRKIKNTHPPSFLVVTASNLYIAYTKLERKLIQNTEYSPSQIKGSEYRLNQYVKGDTRAFLVTQFQIDWYILTPARVDEVVFTSPRDEITESSHIPNTKQIHD